MKFESIFSLDLSLRIITSNDVDESYVRWLQDPEVNKYLEVRLEVVNLDTQRDYVAKIYDSLDICLFGIFVEADRMIGTIKIGPIDKELRTAELGLIIGDPRFWGKGYGTKAIEMICGAFLTSGLLKVITAGVYGGNIGSRKAFEKNDFVLESSLQTSDLVIDGELQEIIRYRKT